MRNYPVVSTYALLTLPVLIGLSLLLYKNLANISNLYIYIFSSVIWINVTKFWSAKSLSISIQNWEKALVGGLIK